MAKQIPLVDYLVLGNNPHLTGQKCANCGAIFFDRRNACASCSKTDFIAQEIASEGILRTFTIVSLAAPGIPVPFVAGVVECDGVSVRGNIINTEPDPDHVQTGMKVRLATYSVGTDDDGVEAIGFGYEPIS
ncbi:MAG: OB-fold domain-containing protein [Acidimicrobiales bacterium]|nr:OB-fold domain-containing protein [Acidimicrobiales bacterium]